MPITQAKRLPYTRKDLESLHDDVSKYFKEFIPTVTDTSEMNPGRIFLTLIESLVDNSNFSVDQAFLELLLLLAKQRKNIVQAAYMLGYYPTSVSAASVDLTATLQSGVAGAGGFSIPVYTRFQTSESPTIEFLAAEATTIPEGEPSIPVPAIQGIRVSGEVLAASASGLADQKYQLENAKTPHSLVEIYINGIQWERVSTFANSDDESQHYMLQFDEDDYTSVIFGDGEAGKSPDSGDVITSTYIHTAADQGNATVGTISRVIGSLASDIVVTNGLNASGGAVSESNDSIKRNAPALRRSGDRIVTTPDHEAVATAVEGVYKAFAVFNEGTRTDVYLMPEGGGVASSVLIGQAQTALDDRKLDGAIPVADTLQPAGILVSVNVITKTSNIQKSAVRNKVKEETEENLVYTELIRGRAFTQSDLSGIYEGIDDGALVDYVDFTVLSRVPRVQKSSVSAPDIINRVQIGETAGYDEYLITALTTTTFVVAVNSSPQSVTGVVATEFTTDGGEVTFTLGITGDTLTVGDTWRFKTSKYADNIVIDSDEFMELQDDGDLVISVFFPNEYNIRTKTAA